MQISKNCKPEVSDRSHVTTAAAILQKRQTRYLGHLWTDFDEISYTDAKTHTDLEKPETASTRVAAILKIDKRDISAFHEPISTKICTKFKRHMPKSENSKPEVLDWSYTTAAVAIL